MWSRDTDAFDGCCKGGVLITDDTEAKATLEEALVVLVRYDIFEVRLTVTKQLISIHAIGERNAPADVGRIQSSVIQRQNFPGTVHSERGMCGIRHEMDADSPSGALEGCLTVEV